MGTSDDVMALAYISVGEQSVGGTGLTRGDGTGPVKYSGGRPVLQNRGVASWYLDANGDGRADQNGEWGSYYVNGGDPAWQQLKLDEVREKLTVLGADGIFMDTVDTASPDDSYAWTNAGMSELIRKLHQAYPDAPLVANRGLHYFDPDSPAYANTIRPYVSGVMFENYYTTWNYSRGRGELSSYWRDQSTYWAPRLQAEANKADGFRVMVLDYVNPSQSGFASFLAAQRAEVARWSGWLNSINEIQLESIFTQLLP
jgi:hypothetical protein